MSIKAPPPSSLPPPSPSTRGKSITNASFPRNNSNQNLQSHQQPQRRRSSAGSTASNHSSHASHGGGAAGRRGSKGGGHTANGHTNANNNNNSNSNHNKGGGGNAQRRRSSRGAKGGGGGGGSSLQAAAAAGGGSSLQQQAQAQQQPPPYKRRPLEEIELLTMSTDEIQRYTIAKFFKCRMDCLDPLPVSVTPSDDKHHDLPRWTPHEKCSWRHEQERLDYIKSEMDVVWNFTPLEVNEETRWKSKVMKQDSTDDDDENKAKDEEARNQERLRQVFALLNKLSWTTLEKLYAKFVKDVMGVGDGKEVVLTNEVIHDIMKMIVDKASMEAHFAELYAVFCSRIARLHKAFKKQLLNICFEEFEDHHDTSDAEIAKKLPADMDPADKEIEIFKAKKKTLGLMQFIGELYKMDMIKGHIIIDCLQRLLGLGQDDVDDTGEDQLGAFAKLMTTVGNRLSTSIDSASDDNESANAAAKEIEEVWQHIYSMAGRPYEGSTVDRKAPTARIKFLFQDLIELKDNGWVHERRNEEKAKTLAQIHKEVAAEEQQQHQQNRRGGGNNNRRNNSIGNSQPTRMARAQSSGSTVGSGTSSQQAQVQEPEPEDDDGFVQVSKAQRKPSFRRSQSDSSASSPMVPRPVKTMPQSSLQMAVAGGGSSSKRSGKSPRTTKQVSDAAATAPPLPIKPTINEYLDPKQCGDKAKNILQEYFVGGDTNDAVQSFEELIGAGHEGDVERASAMVESSVLMVMEMKEEHATKLLTVMAKCIELNKLPKEAYIKGLQDPLEFLRDIEIDAPPAPALLGMIIADWLRKGVLSMENFAKDSGNCPEYFLSDGKPASFFSQVALKRYGDVDSIPDGDLSVISSLMTEEDKSANPDVKSFVSCQMSAKK